jgi:hypothetical protein
MSRSVLRVLLNCTAMGTVLLLVITVPATARPAAKDPTPTMSVSTGHAATSKYAAAVAQKSEAATYRVEDCEHDGQSRVDCATLYNFHGSPAVICTTDTQAYYRRTSIEVRTTSKVICRDRKRSSSTGQVMPISQGRSAISGFAADMAANSGDGYRVTDCKHHGPSRVFCTVVLVFQSPPGATCTMEMEAVYLGGGGSPYPEVVSEGACSDPPHAR